MIRKIFRNKNIILIFSVLVAMLSFLSYFKYSNNQNKLLTSEESNSINENKLLDSSNTIKKIASGEAYTAAIVNDGSQDKLFIWGLNHYGQLGLGDEFTKDYYSEPQELTFFSNKDRFSAIEDVEVSFNTTSVLVKEGGQDKLYTFGWNEFGQMGVGDNEDYNTPQEVTFFSDSTKFQAIEEISVGSVTMSAIAQDTSGKDKLYTWGQNIYGELGLGDEITSNQNTPQEVTTLSSFSSIKQISMGTGFSAAVVNDGQDKLYTWGLNTFGQLGLGNTTDTNIPTYVDSLGDFKEIKQIVTTSTNVKNGMSSCAAIVVDDSSKDKIYAWGGNAMSGLGIGGTETQLLPVELTFFSDPKFTEIKQIQFQGHHSMALTKEGEQYKVYGWGENDDGQTLGDGSLTPSVETPQEVTFFSDSSKFLSIEQIAIAVDNSFVLVQTDSGNQIYGFGSNINGQLGLGEDSIGEVVSSPAYIASKTNFIKYIDDSLTINGNSISFKINLLSSDAWQFSYVPDGYTLSLESNDKLIKSDIATPLLGENEYTVNDLEYGTTYKNTNIVLYDESGNLVYGTLIGDGTIKIDNNFSDILLNDFTVTPNLYYSDFAFSINKKDPSLELNLYELVLQIKEDGSSDWVDGQHIIGNEEKQVSLRINSLKKDTSYSYQVINLASETPDTPLEGGEGTFKTSGFIYSNIKDYSVKTSYDYLKVDFDVQFKDELGQELPSGNVYNYILEVSTTIDFKPDSTETSINSFEGGKTSTGSLMVNNLSKNTKYYWRVVDTLNEDYKYDHSSGDVKTLKAPMSLGMKIIIIFFIAILLFAFFIVIVVIVSVRKKRKANTRGFGAGIQGRFY